MVLAVCADQVKAIKVPTAWVCAEGTYLEICLLINSFKLLSEDMFFPESLRLASDAVFAERKDKENYIDYELKVYKGKDKELLLAQDFYYCFIQRRWTKQ